MKILYIILTCEKYLNSRCDFVRRTWLRDLEESDGYLFLSSVEDASRNIVGYNTNDTYEYATMKFVELFKNYAIGDYDYVFFCDDDTFVRTERLKSKIAELGNFDCYGRIGRVEYNPVLVGNNKNYFPITYPSGGAGFLITKEIFLKLKDYISLSDHPVYLNTDVSFGAWFSDINVNIIEGCDLLKAQNPDHPENHNIEDFITYHYCSESHFDALYKNKSII